VTPVLWSCPLSAGGAAEELALTFDDFRRWRLLIVPALFDEGNKLRRFTVEVMRRLDGAGVDTFLIDLPGTNESLQSLEAQTPEVWREAVAAASRHFRVSHVLGLRGGCLFAPGDLPGWHYAPISGAQILRQLIRGRILAAREAGREESVEGLTAQGQAYGLELAGHHLGAEFLSQFPDLIPPSGTGVAEIDQVTLGGGGLWLRAEPDEDRIQADALAALIAIGIKG